MALIIWLTCLVILIALGIALVISKIKEKSMSIFTDNWLVNLIKTNIKESKGKPWYKNDIVRFFMVIALVVVAYLVATSIFKPVQACEGRHLSLFVGLGNNQSRVFKNHLGEGNPIGIADMKFKFEKGLWFFPKTMRPVVGYVHNSSAPLEHDSGGAVDMIYGGLEWIPKPLW